MMKRQTLRRCRPGFYRTLRRAGVNVLVASLAVASVSLGCGTTVRAYADWERGADLEPSKTFSVTRSPQLPKDLTPEQEKLVAIVEATTKRELARKGYQEAPPAEAQLIATAHFSTRERSMTNPTNCDEYWRYQTFEGGMVPTGSVPPCQESVITQFEQSMLFIDVYDTTRKQLVWHGWATGKKPEKGDSEVPDLVQRATLDILEGFPP